MNHLTRRTGCKSSWLRPSCWIPVLAVLLGPAGARAQREGDDTYLLGEARRLEIVVHVMGEVTHPGEYRVPDDTDVLELVSKAGGPTSFANLGNVHLRRRDPAGRLVQGPLEQRVDLSGFLKDEGAPAPPMLGPGDVVTVPRNKMSKWRTAFTMVRDISVVVTAYLLYVRVEQNN